MDLCLGGTFVCSDHCQYCVVDCVLATIVSTDYTDWSMCISILKGGGADLRSSPPHYKNPRLCHVCVKSKPNIFVYDVYDVRQVERVEPVEPVEPADPVVHRLDLYGARGQRVQPA